MNHFCNEYLIFRKSINIQLKRKRDGKFNHYYRYSGSCFKRFATIDEEEIRNLLNNLN